MVVTGVVVVVMNSPPAANAVGFPAGVLPAAELPSAVANIAAVSSVCAVFFILFILSVCFRA